MEGRINKVLKDKSARDIFYSALKVLCDVGVRCDHKKAIDILKQKGKVTYNNGRIFFDTDELEDFFENNKKKFKSEKPDDEFKLNGQWHCWELCDPVTNRPRLATMEEAIQMAKLSEALGGNGFPIPVAPGDIEPRMHTLVSEKIALVHTRNLGYRLTLTDNEEIRIISDMFKAGGRKYKLGLEGLITPLKLNTETLNVLLDWCDDPDVEISIMGNIPMAGATAPLIYPANLVLAVAESLALDYVCQKLSNGKLQDFGLRLEPFDMKDNNIVYGSPEWCLMRQSVLEVWEGLTGNQLIYGSFRSNSRIVDAQSMMERTASFIWQALLGVRSFTAVGQISVDEVYSPVQAILDREIMKYGKRLMAGIGNKCWDDSLDVVNIIWEGVENDGFLTHDTTLDTFREMYDFDRMASYCNLHSWRNGGSRTMEAQAWEEAQAIIRKHDFELDDTKRRDVEKIFQKGLKYLSSK